MISQLLKDFVVFGSPDGAHRSLRNTAGEEAYLRFTFNPYSPNPECTFLYVPEPLNFCARSKSVKYKIISKKPRHKGNDSRYNSIADFNIYKTLHVSNYCILAIIRWRTDLLVRNFLLNCYQHAKGSKFKF